ncbi:MAG TPA: phosphate ABC transporter permease PstA [Dehalococcoidia bacterium]|nr:phosphate ABC transporter permease PstA [Dehalococcoidia bacterium]
MRSLIWLAAVVAVLPLLLVLFYVVSQGLPALRLSLFTEGPRPLGQQGGGVKPAIVGSLIMVGVGALAGTPIAVLTGVYVREYAGARSAIVVRFLIDVLAGVPAIIVGLFIYGLIVVPMGGFSALAGAIALAVILIPGVARVTDEMLALVPGSVREASYALGVPRWRTVVQVVLPAALNGVITGVVLSVARISGEAAPLIFTALGNSVTSTALRQPMDALPLRIWLYASGPYTVWHQQAWAASLVLVGLVLCFALILRVLFRRPDLS